MPTKTKTIRSPVNGEVRPALHRFVRRSRRPLTHAAPRSACSRSDEPEATGARPRCRLRSNPPARCTPALGSLQSTAPSARTPGQSPTPSSGAGRRALPVAPSCRRSADSDNAGRPRRPFQGRHRGEPGPPTCRQRTPWPCSTSAAPGGWLAAPRPGRVCAGDGRSSMPSPLCLRTTEALHANLRLPSPFCDRHRVAARASSAPLPRRRGQAPSPSIPGKAPRPRPSKLPARDHP